MRVEFESIQNTLDKAFNDSTWCRNYSTRTIQDFEEAFNIKLIVTNHPIFNHIMITHIEFPSEQDYIWFLLKWA